MSNIFKKIEMFVVVVIIAGIGIVYAFKQKPVAVSVVKDTTMMSAESPKNDLNQQAPETTIIYGGQDGKTALQLLQTNHIVTTEFDGSVSSIDGVIPDATQVWSMYVNGELSQELPGVYVTKSSDSIKWQIEEMKSN